MITLTRLITSQVEWLQLVLEEWKQSNPLNLYFDDYINYLNTKNKLYDSNLAYNIFQEFSSFKKQRSTLSTKSKEINYDSSLDNILNFIVNNNICLKILSIISKYESIDLYYLLNYIFTYTISDIYKFIINYKYNKNNTYLISQDNFSLNNPIVLYCLDLLITPILLSLQCLNLVEKVSFIEYSITESGLQILKDKYITEEYDYSTLPLYNTNEIESEYFLGFLNYMISRIEYEEIKQSMHIDIDIEDVDTVVEQQLPIFIMNNYYTMIKQNNLININYSVPDELIPVPNPNANVETMNDYLFRPIQIEEYYLTLIINNKRYVSVSDIFSLDNILQKRLQYLDIVSSGQYSINISSIELYNTIKSNIK